MTTNIACDFGCNQTVTTVSHLGDGVAGPLAYDDLLLISTTQKMTVGSSEVKTVEFVFKAHAGS